MAKYEVKLKGFEGQNIEIQTGGMFSGTKLLVNGVKATFNRKKRCMNLRANDGRLVQCKWKPKMFGLDVPSLVVDGEVIQVVKPLKWFIWIWCVAIPVLLLYMGGAIGGFIGTIGAIVNIAIFRSDINILTKFVLTAILSALVLVVFFFSAGLLLTALGK